MKCRWADPEFHPLSVASVVTTWSAVVLVYLGCQLSPQYQVGSGAGPTRPAPALRGTYMNGTHWPYMHGAPQGELHESGGARQGEPRSPPYYRSKALDRDDVQSHGPSSESSIGDKDLDDAFKDKARPHADVQNTQYANPVEWSPLGRTSTRNSNPRVMGTGPAMPPKFVGQQRREGREVSSTSFTTTKEPFGPKIFLSRKVSLDPR